MNRYVCIHGHFYQPPRENPWLEEVELQDSAYPYHDWNERITAECYAPNTASRMLDSETRIIEIVNNYASISFNFGPTLLSWLQRHRSVIYQYIIEVDKESIKRFSGHGSAIAQAYSHMIMPLANARDKRTQILWGLRDFEYRFGRKPEGMWLPETAVDYETLEIMAEEGIRFTILAPGQAQFIRKIGTKKWKDVSGARIDPKMPYRCTLPSKKVMYIFFYDGPVAHDISFGKLLENGEAFAQRLAGLFSENSHEPELVHIATDGETYGHHHRFGDMALTYCLHYLESKKLAQVTIYGEILDKIETIYEVDIFEKSSWSCFHGVERWRADCGCFSGMHSGWSQQWREPLRQAMDWLRDTLIPIYEEQMNLYVKDPWRVRDKYIDLVLDRSIENAERFLKGETIRDLTYEEKVRVLKLLEMQRHAMLMYTSCGWFFEEISGIETVQVMQYAARAMQLAKELIGIDFESEYLNILKSAKSNMAHFEDGAQVYNELVKPLVVDLLRAGAHYAISSVLTEYSEKMKVYCYSVENEIYKRYTSGKQTLVVARTKLRSEITLEESVISFAVLHLGDHNFNGGLREYMGESAFDAMHNEIRVAFEKQNVAGVLQLMQTHFGMHNYSLTHLFRGEQRKVLDSVLKEALKEAEAVFRQVYQHHYPVMQVMKDMQTPLPKALEVTVGFILNMDLCKMLKSNEIDIQRLRALVEETQKWSVHLDQEMICFEAEKKMNALMEQLFRNFENLDLLKRIEELLGILRTLPFPLNFWRTQNLYFSVGQNAIESQKAKTLDPNWVDVFRRVGEHLGVKSL